MATLTIKEFSCIDEAEIRLSRLTVLIGPQASGKSVISKLVYFFNDIAIRQYRELEEGETLDQFEKLVAEDFKKWFPPSAWGPRKFEISFRAGTYFVKIVRKGTKKKEMTTDAVTVNFSPWFRDEYTAVLKVVKEDLADRGRPDMPPDRFWRVRVAARERFQKELSTDYVNWQLFVPAGRSFFTSVGKAIAAFEYSGMLDPLTVRFGRLFTSIRDSRQRRVLRGRRPTEQQQRQRNEMMKQLFGGNITFVRDQEYVVSDDGRKIPFSSLSSGQQELLPLWLSIEYAQEGADRSMVYIEEPEAHLFPTAQSQVVEFLAAVISERDARMVVTTHSPYVLTQINILIKAGMLAKQFPQARPDIQKVVPARCWLQPGSTVAYAIVGRRVIQITDDDGLLDGDYLDEVSGYLEREFSSLINIEIKNAS
ncbi:hypothetical protein CO683_36275 [Bradyrhizobium ottawaense]|uniref:AAA family ATPase n=1 Tax=Bradyrhizobium ottawaense TaxID=931866 RepID=UPI000BE7C064|nr:ATP-binding protein [Bradyrhizobium ottawaense]PDT64732.1 hypothetical protein CO683_36275 [Bradyrhizobium ottawaense]